MSNEMSREFRIAYADGLLSIQGTREHRLRITAQTMVSNLLAVMDDRALDLLAISAGAYALDRIYQRSSSPQNDAGIRTLRVCFCVAEPAFWSAPDITDQVSEVLHFLTGDLWIVSFAPHPRGRVSEEQLFLGMECARPSRVALYSGGLDSAAGLACSLLEGQRDIVLLTAGHQTSIRRRSKDQVKSLSCILPSARSIGHASFVLHLQRAGRLRDQETTQRSRGFLFCASGAILAAACGVEQIDVYENGQGAINLPLTASGLANGLSTRGAHPTFLAMMSRLASQVFGAPLRFNLPFSERTKAQMVAHLAGSPELIAWAQESRSCVHTSLRQVGISHCGRCPACIERHQAFEAAGVVDQTHYGERLWTRSDALDDAYFAAYLWQAHRWANGNPEIHARLADHCALSRTQTPLSTLADLHRTHAREVLRTYSPHVSGSPEPRPEPAHREAA